MEELDRAQVMVNILTRELHAAHEQSIRLATDLAVAQNDLKVATARIVELEKPLAPEAKPE